MYFFHLTLLTLRQRSFRLFYETVCLARDKNVIDGRRFASTTISELVPQIAARPPWRWPIATAA
jgi:hypothetical protein